MDKAPSLSKSQMISFRPKEGLEEAFGPYIQMILRLYMRIGKAIFLRLVETVKNSMDYLRCQ